MKHQEMIMVIEAHSEGKLIQVRRRCGNAWIDTTIPDFDFRDCEYRIKPSPKYKTLKEVESEEKFVEIKALEDALELSSGMTMTDNDIAIYKELYSLLN